MIKEVFAPQRGYTLIELLVTITIIGTLTAIAIPQYQEYRKRAFDLQATSDLRNIAIAEEAYFIDNQSYLSCSGVQCQQLPGIASLSKGVSLTVTAAEDYFTSSAKHSKGSRKVFHWDSRKGGLLR